MYSPCLLLCCEDQHPSVTEAVAVGSGICVEYFIFLFMGCYAWFVAVSSNAKTLLQNGYFFAPLTIFDIFVLFVLLIRFYRSYPWLLNSEKRKRVKYAWSLTGRVLCVASLFMFLRDICSLEAVVLSNIVWVTLTITLSFWAESADLAGRPHSLWRHIPAFQLISFLVVTNTFLKTAGYFEISWSFVLWPLSLFALSTVASGYVLWYFTRLEQNPTVDLFLRGFIVGLILMGTLYFLGLRSLGLWLEGKHPYIQPRTWGLPLVVAQSLTFVYSLLITAVYVAQKRYAHYELPEYFENSTCNAMDNRLREPPIFKNMRLTLAKVGDHFYRVRHVLDNGEAAGKAMYIEEAQKLLASGLGPSYKSVSKDDGGHDAEVQSRDTNSLSTETADELCIICCQKRCDAVFLHCGHGGMCVACAQTCLHRTGICPACRRVISGVAKIDCVQISKNEEYSLQTSQSGDASQTNITSVNEVSTAASLNQHKPEETSNQTETDDVSNTVSAETQSVTVETPNEKERSCYIEAKGCPLYSAYVADTR